MPRQGHETGAGIKPREDDDVVASELTPEGRRVGREDSGRLITKEEAVQFKKQGKLKCPGHADEGPCDNYMTDLTMNRMGKEPTPMRKPQLYCSTCHFGLRLYER